MQQWFEGSATLTVCYPVSWCRVELGLDDRQKHQNTARSGLSRHLGTRACRLIQLTDCHLLAHTSDRMYGVDTHATLRAVLESVRAWGPDVVVVTGDLADLGEALAYQRLRPLLLSLGCPVCVVPGNHDDPAVLRETLLGGAISWSPVWRAGGWQLLLLNSHVPECHGGRLSAAAIAELEETLAAEPDMPALVFVHHPPFAVGSSWLDCMGLEAGEELIARLQRHVQVRALVAGHVHQAFDARRGGLRLLTTPSTCSQALPGQDAWVTDPLGPGFRWFELSETGLRTGLTRVDVP